MSVLQVCKVQDTYHVKDNLQQNHCIAVYWCWR